MKEWSEKNRFNSFNSLLKGMSYYDRFVEISKWQNDKNYPLIPPIEISLDFFSGCQLRCQHCNFSKYLSNNIVEKMDDNHIISLLNFFGNWNVNGYKVCGICAGGGGESTLHPKLWDALILSTRLGMQNGIATNGINFNKETIDIAVNNCRWIGVSVDCANRKTYTIGRKTNYFDKVIENIKLMSIRAKELKTTCEIAYKFLVFSYNQHEIFEACKLAKSLGVRDFHCRIADYRHQGLKDWQSKQSVYNIELINKQYKECRELEDNNFRVFCVTHKFNEDFTPKRNFSQCFASPLCLQINPPNDVYMCPDTRNLEYYKLGEHFPNPKHILDFWGKENHWNLVFRNGCNNCISRCTYGYYCKMYQDLFVDNFDPLCRAFV